MPKMLFGIREAKNNLSKLLRHSKEGNEVIITERGKPAYIILPINPRSLSFEERIAEAISSGLIQATAKDCKLPQAVPVTGFEDSLQRYLQEERTDRV
jgi:prevent-host-death family protein